MIENITCFQPSITMEGARGQAFGAAPVLAAPAPTLVLPEVDVGGWGH
jgi:hypothetical protein